MDDTALLAALGEVEPASAGRIAAVLGAEHAAVAGRLEDLERAGRVRREDGEWRLAEDPRLDSSAEQMADRLGRERR
ncbi:MarR family transcriptional regulator [Halalkalicoccus jeotgali]|uniref:Uncharacterized protein n=1 Tax=Halalkalicoccus jeotgali (strain DSM 18796 / CECT 7217 / JCM 14584 / KCTC 4019 / B3) TaxID=795797 RepID=D8J8H6_HALJB|nr:MarR family transcriptional regulator [Halalkalicoccus jeotgali]ADJ16222.1 hypothetical protein HacjB3_14205 [Halalkalicoccus jeotgali B3]ELY37297.1 hypothetical protein C497_09433 [Halalkalicoccus jeotgali B3]